jgi:L-alanine-DL-glutamate epimerase-like enolase superfamily enzyme
VRIASLETLFCDAGWRPWIFLKATTDDGLVGWAEITDSHGSPRGLAGIVEDLTPLVVGRDPRPVEAVYWDLYRATRQSPGSVIAKALAGIENAFLDLQAKALGIPVYELFGGPTRDTIEVRLDPYPENISIVTVAPLFAQAIRSVHDRTSVSNLFPEKPIAKK